ncbi:zinc metallopeptidase [Thiohalobacter sp. IOR34]|uniref:zinc metallopeptidase n=1 Tax=Thiohalobacter sp. IOR34 TaxID=3057176 RepID=UPI0025B1C3E5|nr:zinc metallopeptidase [Thiohalobacter sp. IOR34]WJW75065.1 zinc metallopeptidase [Thiohalobacter sp. IOR34]
MPFLLLLLLLLLLLFGPQLWVRAVLRRHGGERPDFPGSGGEFARHLLDRLGLEGVAVERTEQGDHYDPRQKAVRLSPGHHDGRSLTAVVIAAHEVGHALQDAQGDPLLRLRQRLIGLAQAAQLAGNTLLIGMPLVAALAQTPAAGTLMLLAGLASLGSAALVHLVTLPVELDASFNRALPLLEAGRYLPPADRPAARRILRAAALTYVAASLAGLLNLWRWLRR